MEKETEMKYWKLNQILVQKQKISEDSKCPVRRCKKHQEYTIFVGNDCRLSTLYETSCKKHLSLQVDKSINYRNKYVTEQIEKAKEREIKEAKNILLAV